jgi:hypothetical protein
MGTRLVKRLPLDEFNEVLVVSHPEGLPPAREHQIEVDKSRAMAGRWKTLRKVDASEEIWGYLFSQLPDGTRLCTDVSFKHPLQPERSGLV